MRIEDILSLEAAAKLYLNRAEAISHAGLGWFTDAYGRPTGMRSLESAMDQICRDWCSSVFVYAVSAARQAVILCWCTEKTYTTMVFPLASSVP